MLLQLRVKNLAIIESISIELSPGLNVLTGETGAGKSILLAALNLVLGGRSDRGLVRTGEKESWAEAMFDNNADAQTTLDEWGIDAEEDEPVLLRRIVTNTGRSKAYINGTGVPVSHLRTLGPKLIDFGRQHEQVTLTNPEMHVELLDNFAGTQEHTERVQTCFRHVHGMIRKREKLLKSREDRTQRIEYLQFQYDQIKEVNPQPGELEQLTADLKRLQSVEERRDLAIQADKMMYSGDETVQDMLAQVVNIAESLAELDEELQSVADDLNGALLTVEESSRTLREYQNDLDRDPDQIKDTEDRLDEIIELQDKYGGDFDNLMKRLADIEEELDLLINQEQHIAVLERQIEEGRLALAQAALPLSEARREASDRLCDAIENELKDLAMKNARFRVEFEPLELNAGITCPGPLEGEQQQIGETGAERISFWLAANKGEDLQPMEKVASGGELSRILLALKRVLSDESSVQTFVFDEIDSGIGGEAVTKVARKLRQIATQFEDVSQIICITHTAQIAAEAHKHFRVEKTTSEEGRTHSRVVDLSLEDRVQELARMLAGSQSADHAIALAEDLLKDQLF
jgi:DNA repair protein RecN (Recombination protein N)